MTVEQGGIGLNRLLSERWVDELSLISMLSSFGRQNTLTENGLEGATSSGWLWELVGIVEDVCQGDGIREEQSSSTKETTVGYDAAILLRPLVREGKE